MRIFALLACTLLRCATSQAADDTDAAPDAGDQDVARNCGTQTLCGSTCTDVMKDTSNCGKCGAKCKSGQYCSMGKCTDSCMAPNVACGQFCIDLNTDHENCGKCGTACTANQVCQAKMCVKQCAASLTLCDPDCVNTVSDPNHCGDCNTVCALTKSVREALAARPDKSRATARAPRFNSTTSTAARAATRAATSIA